MVVIAVDYDCFLTCLYKFYGSFSILHDIAFSSGQLRLKEGVSGEKASTLLFFVSIM